MKTLLIVFIFILVFLNLHADGVEPDGSGTEADPYQVATLDNLLWISTNSASWGSHFIQTTSIYATSTSGWNSGSGFSPIGNSFDKFTGTYDGQGKAINNLHINRPSTNYVGLFGATFGAEISNIFFADCSIQGNERVGTVVGANGGNSTINGVTVDNDYFGGGYVTGNAEVGVVAGSNNSSTISQCKSKGGSVTGNSRVGGIVGENSSTSTVDQCRSDVEVIGGGIIGGIVGVNSSSTVNQCSFDGNVSGGSDAAGLAGLNQSGATVNNSHSAGTVEADYYAGGGVGTNLMGCSINKCYTTCFVDSDLYSGSFTGQNFSVVEDCFYNTETSGQTSSGGGTGKTTAELKDVATFTAWITIGLNEPWDFVGDPFDDTGNLDFWNIDGTFNDGYPFLVWEYVPPIVPENVIILITEDELAIIWDEVSGASSYKVYSSDDPDTGFTEDTSGTFIGASWGITINHQKKFYYVTAIID